MYKRRTYSPEFKARVAMEAISGRKTTQEIAADHAIHPIQVSQWKRQLLDGASEPFSRGKNTKDKGEGQANKAELFQQIGRLQMVLEWLKKSLSCSDAREVRKLVEHDHPDLKEEDCLWVSSSVDWYNHRYRHTRIKFVTPQQRRSGQAVKICRQRAVVYEQALLRHPRQWTRSTRCWRQPEVV